MNKTVTVFTPTYNRAYVLPQLYDSLLRQSSRDFIWLVIDDGSSDNTKELVKQWQREADFAIQYIYQDNQGMHGAHNTAYEHIETELNVCIDSDDFMTDDAVASMVSFWQCNGTVKHAGFIALDADKNGNIIGTVMPQNIKETTLTELYQKHKVKGDKKLVLRTEIVNKYPKYPLFEGERFVPLDVLYFWIEKECPFLCLNKAVCVVEYLADGSTQNIFKQYIRHPQGFRFARKERMLYSPFLKDRIKNTIHYVAKSNLLKKSAFSDNPKRLITFMLYPLGVLLYFYIKRKAK